MPRWVVIVKKRSLKPDFSITILHLSATSDNEDLMTASVRVHPANNHIIMKKQLIGLIFSALFFQPVAALAQPEWYDVQIISGNMKHLFRAEMAQTPEQKERGLMFLEMLPADQGMLFVEEAPRHLHMWMKNTLIPLDMLFVDKEKVVFQIVRNAEPNSTTVRSSIKPAIAVLEIAGGTADSLGIREGDVITWQRALPE